MGMLSTLLRPPGRPEAGTVIEQAEEAVRVAAALRELGHTVIAISSNPGEHGLPCVELAPSAVLTAMAEQGRAAFNAFGRDAAGPFRRGTFQRGRVRVFWTDRRATR